MAGQYKRKKKKAAEINSIFHGYLQMFCQSTELKPGDFVLSEQYGALTAAVNFWRTNDCVNGICSRMTFFGIKKLCKK